MKQQKMPAPRKKRTLRTAAKIAATSKTLLLHVQKSHGFEVGLDDKHFLGRSLFAASIGISPMLLALSMELALKAWIVLDNVEQGDTRGHDLLELFSRLSPFNQERLISRYEAEILPHRPSGFYMDDGLKRVLENESRAFIEWRYAYELEHANFECAGFQETVEMVLSEFEKCFMEREVTTKNPGAHTPGSP